MRWLLKEMGDGTLIGLLHFTPKTHLPVSDQPILYLSQAQELFIRRLNSNSVRDLPTELLTLHVSNLRSRRLK